MDGQRFDELVRVTAIDANRRQVLRALAAGLAWALVFPNRKPGVAAQETGAASPTTCRQDSDCVDADADACTGGRCDNGACVFFIVDCVPGYVCCNNGQCCADPPCSEEGGSCADNACCDGLTCERSGRRERVCVATDGRPAPTAVPTATARPSGGSGRTPSTPGGTVVRLPNTGVARETTGAGGPFAGALALAAGAAALVARRLRSVAPDGGDDRV